MSAIDGTRLYTVSSIDSWIIVKAMGKKLAGPKLGKNGGPLCVTDGMISSRANCMKFVAHKQAVGCVSTSDIRRWKNKG